jgi:CheY-like chemotaxis protein
MLAHLYETGLRQVAEGLASLCNPSQQVVAQLVNDLRALSLKVAQLERADLKLAATEAESAARTLLIGAPDAHEPCVEAVNRLGELFLLVLSTEAKHAASRQGSQQPLQRKVLVVDDSRVAAFALSSALVQHEFMVRAVATMEEAIAEIGSFRPCMLISDVHMPDLDVGLLCRTFRANSDRRRRMVVLVSGTTGEELESRLDEVKPDAFVPKMAGTGPVVERVLALWRERESEIETERSPDSTCG